MTKPIESGETDKVIVEGNLNELKGGEGVDGYDHAANLEAQSDPLVDLVAGRPLAIRSFEFSMNPDIELQFPSDPQVLFNTHARQISTILWADGLKPFDQVPPRVIINHKAKKYQIFVPCEARTGVIFADKPRSLTQQLTNKNATTRH